MTCYKPVPAGSINRLINHGPLVLVATHSADGVGNLAPVAWNCPAQKDPPTLVLALGKKHKTTENIEATKEFVVVVPHSSQLILVGAAGSLSGHDSSKQAVLNFPRVSENKIQAPIPDGCVAWLECKLAQTVVLESVVLVIGTVTAGFAQEQAFSDRLMVEDPAAKTLHHLGGKDFMTPGTILHL